MNETDLAKFKIELEYLKNWKVGSGSTFTDLKISEALLQSAKEAT